MPLNAKLVVVGGDVKTAEVELKLPSTIGRGRGTSIVLPHPLVSRQHCELFELNGQLMVRDLGSLNGTFVNNQRITESPLAPNELLTVGTVTFRAVYEPEGGAAAKKDPTLKGTGDKTLPVTKASTLRASPKEAKPPPTEVTAKVSARNNFSRYFSSSALNHRTSVGSYGRISSGLKYKPISRCAASGPSLAWTRFICRLLE